MHLAVSLANRAVHLSQAQRSWHLSNLLQAAGQSRVASPQAVIAPPNWREIPQRADPTRNGSPVPPIVPEHSAFRMAAPLGGPRCTPPNSHIGQTRLALAVRAAAR